MTRHLSRLAGAFLLSLAGLATAATPLLVPVQAAGPRAKSTEGGLPVKFNTEGVDRLAPGEEVELTLPTGSRHTYVHEELISHGGGITTWVARSPITGDNERAVITYGPHGAWGWMATTYGHFRIFPSGEGYDLLAPQPKRNFSPKFAGGDAVRVEDDPPGLELFKGVPTFASPVSKSLVFPKVTPTPTVQADVMLIYTRDMAQKLGVGLIPMLHNLITSLNLAYADSEVAITLRLVNATMMEYPNANGSLDTLNAMNNSGPFAASFAGITHGPTNIRNTVGADFVALLRDGPTDTGGIANLLINTAQYPTVQVNQSNAMSVNNSCAGNCASVLAHEIGHNMGNHHDRATIAKDVNGATPLPSGVFPHSHGHYSCANGLTCNPFIAGGCGTNYAGCNNPNANDFGTIMSYFGPDVMKFSSTSATVTCVPAGGSQGSARPCGGATVAPAPAGTSDNAQSMNQVRGNVSAYRSQVLANAPPSLQFTALTYVGAETGGTVTFTVSRVGGTAGSVSVNYALAPGSASANVDYATAGGMITWADGDGANKTFNVAVTNDGVSEGNETFTATLSNPVGTPGVYLGYPTTASAIITEPWPLNGAPPVGFTNPSGAPWVAATDSTPEGSGASWKSGAVFPSGGAVPPPSVTQFTGEFAAGPLRFDYKVDSYPGAGFFEFLIDGVVVLVESGNPGWKLFTTTLTAGAHTLQWRYRAVLTFACGTPGVSPPPPQGASCADRAWIDNVTLPLAAAPSTTSVVSSQNPSLVGQAVTFTATVTGTIGDPTGTVTFFDGATLITGCAAVPLAGVGEGACTTSSLPLGTHSVSASYSGSSSYSSSFSTPITQLVASSTQLLSANPALINFGGQSMNTTSPVVTSTITNTSGSPVTVTGVVVSTGYAASHNCTTIPGGGTCLLSITFTPGVQGSVSGSVTLDYSGGGPTIVGMDGVGERSLVTHYYRSILRRAPDAGGKTFWENEATRVSSLGAIASGDMLIMGVNVNETWFAMAQSFYFSPEYAAFNRNNTGFITDLFNTFFNRAPDPGGQSFWVGQLDSGLPREVALASFMFSTEFTAFTQAIFGNTAARAEVNTVVDFYRGLLARLPDNGGFNYWVGRFRTAQCAGVAAVNNEVESISSAYALSPEYAARNRSNSQYVGDLYNAFLRRGGDLGGVNYWIGQIAGGFRTREQVRIEFKNSAEFQARVTAIVNQGCLP